MFQFVELIRFIFELFFFEVLRNDSIFQVLFCSSYIKINFRIAESVPSVMQYYAD